MEEAGTSVVRVQVETMSLALRLRESRWFRSALEQPHTLPEEKRLNGAGNGDLGLSAGNQEKRGKRSGAKYRNVQKPIEVTKWSVLLVNV